MYFGTLWKSRMNFPYRQKNFVNAYLHKRQRAIVHHTLEGKSIASLIGVKLITAEGGANTFAPKCSATTAPIKIVNNNDGRCTFSMTRRIVPTFSIGNPISMHQRLCLFGVLVVKVISFIWGFGLVILLGLRLHRNAAASSPCNSTSMSWQWSNRLILLVLNLVVRSMLTVSLHCNTELEHWTSYYTVELDAQTLNTELVFMDIDYNNREIELSQFESFNCSSSCLTCCAK